MIAVKIFLIVFFIGFFAVGDIVKSDEITKKIFRDSQSFLSEQVDDYMLKLKVIGQFEHCRDLGVTEKGLNNQHLSSADFFFASQCANLIGDRLVAIKLLENRRI